MQQQKIYTIIGRYSSLSLYKIRRIKNVRAILIASWLIYIKYQLTNQRILNIENINKEDSRTRSWKKMDPNWVTYPSNIIQIVLTYLVGKFWHGRLILTIYVILILNCLMEIFFGFYSYRNLGQTQTFFLIKSILVYLLYFMVCQIGIIYISKENQLKTNQRIIGSLVCLVISSQFIIFAVLCRFIKQIVVNFYLSIIFEQGANFGCGYLLLDILKNESREVPVLAK